MVDYPGDFNKQMEGLPYKYSDGKLGGILCHHYEESQWDVPLTPQCPPDPTDPNQPTKTSSIEATPVATPAVEKPWLTANLADLDDGWLINTIKSLVVDGPIISKRSLEIFNNYTETHTSINTVPIFEFDSELFNLAMDSFGITQINGTMSNSTNVTISLHPVNTTFSSADDFSRVSKELDYSEYASDVDFQLPPQ